MADCSLSRSERLRAHGAVQRLFKEGERGFIYPFRYQWFAEEDTTPSVEVLFTVPKKFHKRANKRNLLRRRTKEAYRLQKQVLSHIGSVNLDMALIYSSNEILEYTRIEHAVRKILEAIADHF